MHLDPRNRQMTELTKLEEELQFTPPWSGFSLPCWIRIQWVRIRSTAHLDPHDDWVDGLTRSSTSRQHDPDSVYHAGSGSKESGSEALLTCTRMMTESMAWARSSTPATMIRIQLKNYGSGSNESGSESPLTWTRMKTESMAWARSSTPGHHDPDSVKKLWIRI